MLKEHFPPLVASFGTKGILLGFIIGVPAWALGEFFGMVQSATSIEIPDIWINAGVVAFFILAISLAVWFIRSGIEVAKINRHVREQRRLLRAIRKTLSAPNIPESTRSALEDLRHVVINDLRKIDHRNTGLVIHRRPFRIRFRW